MVQIAILPNSLILSEKKFNHYGNSTILAGDFNLVLNPNKDTSNYVNVNNPRARDTLIDNMNELNLIDVWRENNIETLQYTWFRHNSNKKARLDFYLISENLYTDVKETKILPGYRTDHSMVIVTFDFGNFIKGKSYWKFNNSLLKDLEYVEEVKKVINRVKYQYASEIQNSNLDIKDMDIEDLKLSINSQLFLETLLFEIRGKTISYSTFKKRKEENKEKLLLNEIDNLEKMTIIDSVLLNQKKSELENIRLNCKVYK